MDKKGSFSNLITISKGKASLCVDLTNGAKVINLNLVHPTSGRAHEIIKGVVEKDPDLGNGSYLMYPWNSRLEGKSAKVNERSYEFEPVFNDRGMPIHGYVAFAEREIVELSDSYIVLKPKVQIKDFPSFHERMELVSESKFTQRIEFFIENSEHKMHYFAFGYHPYIGLDNERLDSCEIETNLTSAIELNSMLLPQITEDKSLKKLPINEIIPNLKELGRDIKLDNCFVNDNSEKDKGTFFKLHFKKANASIIVSNTISEKNKIDLKYFTLYTPNLVRIAVEPQTSPPNSFFLGPPPKYLVTLEGEEPKAGEYCIELI